MVIYRNPQVSLGIGSMKATDLEITQDDGTALDVTNQETASMAINAYDMAIPESFYRKS